MQRLSPSAVQPFRLQTLAKQGGRCAICGNSLAPADAVLDHDHISGEVRGVLHRGCNSMLGKIENHRRIAKLTSTEALAAFLQGVLPYLSKDGLGVLYPSFRTAEEKRLRTNARRRKARAAKKEEA
jgi:hypothetical protein